MIWFNLLGALLKLAASLAAYLKDRQLLDAGAKAQIASDLLEITKRADLADQIRAELARLSDSDLDQELRQ